MYTLLIDGNFFAQRTRNACGLTFTKQPEADKAELFTSLSTALGAQLKQLGTSVSNVIILRDYSNWRKLETPVEPKESERTEEEATYKENRNVEHDYDIRAFFAAYDEWCQTLNTKFGVGLIRSYRSEADDLAYIVSFMLNKLGKKVLLYSSDGDWIHLINENVALLKLPKKELYIHKQEKVESKNLLENVFNTKPDTAAKLKDAIGSDKIQSVNPYHYLLAKVISGDAKDNVPPIYFWKSNGAKPRTYKPSWSHIKKAYVALGRNLDTATVEDLYNETFVKQFIIELLRITKKDRDIAHTVKVFESNLKLLHLDKRSIPKDIIKQAIEDSKSQIGKVADIKKLCYYKNILDAIGTAEAGTFFSNFNFEKKDA